MSCARSTSRRSSGNVGERHVDSASDQGDIGKSVSRDGPSFSVAKRRSHGRQSIIKLDRNELELAVASRGVDQTGGSDRTIDDGAALRRHRDRMRRSAVRRELDDGCTNSRRVADRTHFSRFDRRMQNREADISADPADDFGGGRMQLDKC